MEAKIKDKNLYYVGGVVRDEILGIENFDIDYCYEGNALEFAKEYNIVKKNSALGTVRVCIDGEEIDIASTRIEEYPLKGHLPVVTKIGCSLKDDLKRRDFTINAIAKNTVTNEIVDCFNGVQDIQSKKLKVLHSESFIEDPSRILRGLKFSVRFGFILDDETKKLQDEYLNNINYDLSFYRIKKELKETFNLNKQVAFEKFIEQGVYKLLGPNQKLPNPLTNIEELIIKYPVENPWIIYAGMFDLSNFELTGEEAAILNDFDKIKEVIPNNHIEIYNLFKSIKKESVLLYGILVDFSVATLYLDSLADIKPLLTGKDLLNLGIPPGENYKQILNFLAEAKVKNPNLSKDDEINLVKEFVS